MLHAILDFLGIKPYRIDHYPGKGYVPMTITPFGWETINEGAWDTSMFVEFGPFFRTIEEAGAHIDKYAMNHGRQTVWQG